MPAKGAFLPRPDHCEIAGCHGAPYRRRRWPKNQLTWLCSAHHQRLMKKGDPHARSQNAPRSTCDYPGCTNKRTRQTAGRLARRCEQHRGKFTPVSRARLSAPKAKKQAAA